MAAPPNAHDVLDAMLQRLFAEYNAIQLPENENDLTNAPGQVIASFKISPTINARLTLEIWAGEAKDPPWAAQREATKREENPC